MSRTLPFGLLFTLLCAAAASCISPPDYPDAPNIKFKKLEVVRLPAAPGTIPIDSDTITIAFEDGNGDLGLSAPPADTQPPFQQYLDEVNKIPNPDYNNYFIQPQIKVNDEWVDFTDPSSFENSRFPRLGPESDKEAPLKGDLRLNIRVRLGSPFKPGDEIRFRISIKDRALNQSNEIFTDSYVVKPR